jgi:plastocyanin
MTSMRARFMGSLATLALLAGCGGSSTSPSSVTVIVRDGGSGGTNGATITLTGSGVSARSVTIAVGQTVTFINNDNRSHEMASDPHPQHGSCPSMENGLGTIGAGQTRVTHAFANAGTCGYHDHLDASNPGFLGTIVVQ